MLGFNLIWLTDKVTELNEELDAMLRYICMHAHAFVRAFVWVRFADGFARIPSCGMYMRAC